jgi:hypothetical protein
VDRTEFRELNQRTMTESLKPARSEPLLLGITKASLTTESFISDAVLIRAGGHVTSRIDLMFATGYSNGRTGDALTEGTYRTYTGTAQLRAGVARWAAAIINYNYFNYDLTGIVVTGAASTVPSSFDRQAIRFGLQLWLPLIGGYVERPTDRTGDF